MFDEGDGRLLFDLLLLLPVAAGGGEAEDVLPEAVRRHSLHGGEDDVVDAGQQHEEDPVGEAQRVPEIRWDLSIGSVQESFLT